MRFLKFLRCFIFRHRWKYYADAEGGGLNYTEPFKVNFFRECRWCKRLEIKVQEVDFEYRWEKV